MSAPIGIGSKLGNVVLNSAFGGGALGVPAHYTGELLNYGAKKALPYIRNVKNGGGLFDKIVRQ